MRDLIRKCPNCKRYTMRDICDKCGVETRTSHPPRYSPDDRYRIYKARIGREYVPLLID
ncbi:RNA-protein complex protein Nop10 [Candidatus Geothermarchaeota archaeon]|nr:MAG: RNA-protein complex protein Nop10 [Candidatus Geothermarchaeota archaeon]